MNKSLAILRVSALVVLSVYPGTAATQENEILLPAEQRKQAPELGLEDTAGKQANLKDYRGKVVVGDFWPWYGDQGIGVI